MSQAGLFGGAVESSAQQFSAAQKRTVADPAASCCHPAASSDASVRSPSNAPSCDSAPSRPAPAAASPWPRRGGGRRKAPQPVPAPQPAERQATRRSRYGRLTDGLQFFQDVVAGPLLPLVEGRGRIPFLELTSHL